MKTLVLFLLVAYAGQLQADHVEDLSRLLLRNVLKVTGNRFKDALESFRETMKTGQESLGIPKLDPLNLEYQKINIDEESISAIGTVENLKVNGLSDYTVQNADFKFTTMNATLDLLWSNINGKTKYDVDSEIVKKIPIYGKGDLSFNLEDFNFATKMHLKLKSRKFSIVNISDTKISIKNLKLAITGLFNDEELSEFISGVVSDLVPEIIVDFQEEITTEINKMIQKEGNKLLDQITYDKILGLGH